MLPSELPVDDLLGEEELGVLRGAAHQVRGEGERVLDLPQRAI